MIPDPKGRASARRVAPAQSEPVFGQDHARSV